MGLYSEFICCEPSNIIIDYDLLTEKSKKCFDHMCNKRINCTNLSSKTSGKELEKYGSECMKLYQYLGMDALINWNNFLNEVMEQNSTICNIKFHFYYRDGLHSFYFEIDKQPNENPVTTISSGLELDVLCFDISNVDNFIRSLPELIKIKIKRKYLMKQKNSTNITSFCIPWRECIYEYEFNKKNYKKYNNLMKFKKEYFNDKIKIYKDKIQPLKDEEVRLLLDLFPYAFELK